jgi:hypothetical protein
MTEERPIQIRGGADPHVAAAIAAVINQAATDERLREAEPPRRSHESRWVLSARTRMVTTPHRPTTMPTRMAAEG